MITLAAILAFFVVGHTSTASAWSYNEGPLDLGTKRDCQLRTLTLAPGWYDIQQYIDRPGWAQVKSGSIRKFPVLIKRRGDYGWSNCATMHHLREPKNINGNPFAYLILIETTFGPVPGRGGVDVGIVNGDDDIRSQFFTNSKPGPFNVGSKIFRSRPLPPGGLH